MNFFSRIAVLVALLFGAAALAFIAANLGFLSVFGCLLIFEDPRFAQLETLATILILAFVLFVTCRYGGKLYRDP